MKKELSNELLTVTVNQHGAELCSVKDADGTEYLWRADPSVWGRHAPVLFPIVGKLPNNRYSFDGKTYQLGQHGFARDMEFSLYEQSSEMLSYRLLPTDETREEYPFEFLLEVCYRLSESCLEISYTVTNNDSKPMPFSIGAHPGFALSWGRNDKIEDYFLEFEQQENADSCFLNDDGLLSNRTERILDQESLLPLRGDLFDRNALIFLEMKSKKVTLKSHKHSRKVTVDYPGFPHLGIWAKPGAPFVCIEPWHGYVSPADSDGALVDKPGIIMLSPAKTFQCVHRMSIEG